MRCSLERKDQTTHKETTEQELDTILRSHPSIEVLEEIPIINFVKYKVNPIGINTTTPVMK